KVSDDGVNFHSLGRLKPARSGWQDYAVPKATYSIPTVKARYFRFVFDPKGTEPGSEDLDGRNGSLLLNWLVCRCSVSHKLINLKGKTDPSGVLVVGLLQRKFLLPFLSINLI